MSDEQGEKQIVCYLCGSARVAAAIHFTSEQPPRPLVSFQCTECIDPQLNIPTPICGLEISMHSLKFLFNAEDTGK